jgi:oxalate decarboxylase/phosphoglucose isomerase-like protein (cupin superfamily)
MEGEQTNTSSPSSADVKQGNCTFIPPIRLHGVKEITFKELEFYYYYYYYYYYIFYEFLSFRIFFQLSRVFSVIMLL